MRQRAANVTGFLFSIAFAVYAISVSPSFTIVLIPRILHDAIMAIAFMTRDPVRISLSGTLPRVVAYGRTFFVFAFVTLAAWAQPDWLAQSSSVTGRYVALLLIVFAAILDIWALWHLRAAFSIEPQARRLITSGPYRFVRHPLYSSYLLSYAAALVLHPTVPLAVAILIWGVFVRFSIRYEEEALCRAFSSAYREYQASAGATLPRIRRPNPAAQTRAAIQLT
jgi:protein-S-isoprenylcysteine O-methyltransferase Ste14